MTATAQRGEGELSGPVRVAREVLSAQLAAGIKGRPLTKAFTEAVVAALAPALEHCCSAAKEQDLGRLAVVAVGGLARGWQGPYSDLDLVVLCERPPQGPDSEHYERFEAWMRDLLHPLWDAGMKVNATVQSPTGWLEGAAEDLSMCTSLLETRPLAGDATLVAELRSGAKARYFGDQRAMFIDRLVEEAQQRHVRYGTTVYRVEPDLKFGSGGLRDLAALDWALAATHGKTDLAVLMKEGEMPERAAEVLGHARDHILRLRVALHLSAGRAQDRLVFHLQERLPELLGMVTHDDGPVSDAELVASIETLMQGYYGAALDVLRYGRRVIARCMPPKAGARVEQRLSPHFVLVDGRLEHEPPELFETDPALAFASLRHGRNHHATLSGPTYDAILDATPVDLASNADAQRRFLDLLVEPSDVGSPTPLELCVELGLVSAVVPEFAASRGRMQHEGWHVYTVDQHSVLAVEFLKAVARGEHRKDHPLATAMHIDLDDNRVLYLATLLHDVGKAFGDQLEHGRVIAYKAAKRAGLSETESRRCALLVAEHQSMPMLSQKRDLSDPLLIEEFARRVGTRTVLKELYLISLADMATVSTDYLTQWKRALLDEIYLLTAAHLAGHDRGVERQDRSDEPENLPDRYYLLYDTEMRRQHRGMIEGVRRRTRPMELDLAEGPGALRLTVAYENVPGFLAHATAVLHELGFTVVAADIFSVPGEPSIALDVFRVEAIGGGVGGRGRTRTHHVDEGVGADWLALFERLMLARLGDPRAEAALKTAPTPLPVAGRGRRRNPRTRVNFVEDHSGDRTIVEVETADQPGVLRRITHAFGGLGIDIEIARLASENRRVYDVFYVARLDRGARATLSKRLQQYLRRQ